MADFVQFALSQAQILLRLSQSLQQTIPLLQHGHHQRLKVTLGVRLQRGAGAPTAAAASPLGLADGGHHLAHHLQPTGPRAKRRQQKEEFGVRRRKATIMRASRDTAKYRAVSTNKG